MKLSVCPTTLDGGTDPLKKASGQASSPEGHQGDRSQDELRCPLRRSRCAAAVEARDRLMAQALSQTEDEDV